MKSRKKSKSFSKKKEEKKKVKEESEKKEGKKFHIPLISSIIEKLKSRKEPTMEREGREFHIPLVSSFVKKFKKKEGRMQFRMPFTFSDLEKLKKRSKFFLSHIKHKKNTGLEKNLKNSDIDMTREEYLSISLTTLCFAFVILLVAATTVLVLLGIKKFYLYGPALAFLFSFFVFFSQMVYPRIFVARRQRNIEKNLIPALQDILIQLSSGIPLFSILVNISSSDYGELSIEIKKAVKRINSGEPEAGVLDDIGRKNPSVFFRRTLWQISSGMKSGSDMSIVVRSGIKSLTEEQLIQIQNYGNKLNPLIVFYMLISIIIPSLSITFLIILSSMANLPRNMTTMLFITLFVFVILIQIMFLGLIRSRRPSLL